MVFTTSEVSSLMLLKVALIESVGVFLGDFPAAPTYQWLSYAMAWLKLGKFSCTWQPQGRPSALWNSVSG